MAVIHSLKESLSLLFKRPRIFIPNMSVALIYAVFELILIKLAMDITQGIMYASPDELTDIMFLNLIPLMALFAFYPVLVAMDLITYAMYPCLVSDYHRGTDISLLRALKSSLAAWRLWLTLGGVLILFLIFVLPVTMIPVAIYSFTENIMFLFLAFAIFILAAILLMMTIFFVIPIGIIDGENTIESFKKSYRLGVRYKKEVFSLSFISILIVIIAIALGNIPGIELGKGITYMAVAIFIPVKLMQSVIYTYISVVNPYFYMNVK